MAESIVQRLDLLISQGTQLAPKGGSFASGYNSRLQMEYVSWRMQCILALGDLGVHGERLRREIESDNRGSYFYKEAADRILGVVQAARAIAEQQEMAEGATTKKTKQVSRDITRKVFIVHGQEESLRIGVARFLEHLELEPIILSERPDKGQTIVEKLEAHKDVSFAVVLLTPDDEGKSVKEKELRPRARQNVILELGYFLGFLGRERVCALYDEGVAIPSDYRGVLYIKIDSEKAWQLKLARELKAAGLPVDMNKAL